MYVHVDDFEMFCDIINQIVYILLPWNIFQAVWLMASLHKHGTTCSINHASE